MSPILISGPALEPVALADVKEWLRVDDTTQDDLIAALITSARLIVEASTRRMMITQTWRLALDRWPRTRAGDDWFTPRAKIIELPFAPFQRVTAISVADATGALAALSPTSYAVDANPNSARLYFNVDPPKPASPVAGIAIDLVLGYGDQPTSPPEPLRLAIRMLVARWFENRGDVESDASADRLPGPIGALVAPYRRARLA